jgi:hypothetical protein
MVQNNRCSVLYSTVTYSKTRGATTVAGVRPSRRSLTQASIFVLHVVCPALLPLLCSPPFLQATLDAQTFDPRLGLMVVFFVPSKYRVNNGIGAANSAARWLCAAVPLRFHAFPRTSRSGRLSFCQDAFFKNVSVACFHFRPIL